jgi:hypothetical protein
MSLPPAGTGPRPVTGAARRAIAWSVLRAAGSIAALLAIYYLLPFDHISAWAGTTILVAGLIALIALATYQVRSILSAEFPALRAVEALATSVPLFLLLFAAAYVVMARLSASSFGQPLNHTDALYFAVTVFSTVGFGDITPKTGTARLVVTAQMISDLVILGLAIQVIVGAVKRRQVRPEQADNQRDE